jgi:hypothetical protein
MHVEELEQMRDGTFKPDPNEIEEPDERPYLVEWTNEGCEAAAEWGNDADYCPHTIVPQSDSEPNSEPWMYTVNDAFLGHACGVRGAVVNPGGAAYIASGHTTG